MPVTAKRNAKDSVFADIFEKPEYLIQLYHVLHPEDTDATEDMLQDITIRNVLTDRMYNDLGFTVRNRRMILVESQSTWSVNIIVRAFMYLAQSYQERFESQSVNLYSSKKVDLPEPELYVIYTGEQNGKPEEISLSQEFFEGRRTALDVHVRVLYGGNSGSIVDQYVRFCRVYTNEMKKNGPTREAVLETLRICRDENVLTAYLSEHGKEAIDIMMALFDDEYIQEAYGKEIQRESAIKTWAASVRNIMQKFHISDKNAAIDAVGVPNDLRQPVSDAI